MNEDELKRLYDVIEIQALKARYCAASDAIVKDRAKAAAQFQDLFTEDATCDYGMGKLDGRDALCNFLIDTIGSAMEQLWHSVHTPLIEIDGDTAKGRWSGILRSRPKGADSFQMQYGHYADTFRRTPSGWRIASLRWVGQG